MRVGETVESLIVRVADHDRHAYYELYALTERKLFSSALRLVHMSRPRAPDHEWESFWTALTFVVALPAAYVIGRFTFAGRNVVRAVVIVPFVLPTVVVALAFLAVLPAGLDQTAFFEPLLEPLAEPAPV